MKFLTMIMMIGSLTALANHHGSKWNHQTEASLNTFTGNAETTNIGASHKSTTTFGNGWNFAGFGAYNYAEATVNNSFAITARNWNVGLKLGKRFNTKLQGYYQASMMSDTFQALDSRINNEVGVIYDFIPPVVMTASADEKETNKMGDYNFGSQFLYGKLAYLFSIEDFTGLNPQSSAGALPDNRNNLVVGLGYGTALTSTLAFLSEVDWIRTLGEDDRSLVSAFAGLRSNLSKVFSLKLGYRLNYTNRPVQGLNDTDGQYTLSVLATY